MTLQEAFNPRRNSLNAIRLVLATLVIVSHSWPVGGYGRDPYIGDQSLGGWAVAGFFAISGYLIYGSRENSRSLWRFLKARFFRIYPAFIACLAGIAFIIAPLSLLIDDNSELKPRSNLGYIYHNMFLIINQRGIGGTLRDVPHRDVWNSPLWTLGWEVICYIGIGVLVTLLPRKVMKWVIPAILVICAVMTAYGVLTEWRWNSDEAKLFRLVGYFAAGSTIYLYRDKIPDNKWLAVSALGFVILTIMSGTFQVLAPLPLAYLMMYAGIHLPFPEVGRKNDISYGMYIWAFPVQQLLAILLPNQIVPVWVFVIISVLLTIPLAWASWRLIEKPAIALKDWKPQLPRRSVAVVGS